MAPERKEKRGGDELGGFIEMRGNTPLKRLAP